MASYTIFSKGLNFGAFQSTNTYGSYIQLKRIAKAHDSEPVELVADAISDRLRLVARVQAKCWDSVPADFHDSIKDDESLPDSLHLIHLSLIQLAEIRKTNNILIEGGTFFKKHEETQEYLKYKEEHVKFVKPISVSIENIGCLAEDYASFLKRISDLNNANSKDTVSAGREVFIKVSYLPKISKIIEDPDDRVFSMTISSSRVADTTINFSCKLMGIVEIKGSYYYKIELLSEPVWNVGKGRREGVYEFKELFLPRWSLFSHHRMLNKDEAVFLSLGMNKTAYDRLSARESFTKGATEVAEVILLRHTIEMRRESIEANLDILEAANAKIDRAKLCDWATTMKLAVPVEFQMPLDGITPTGQNKKGTKSLKADSMKVSGAIGGTARSFKYEALRNLIATAPYDPSVYNSKREYSRLRAKDSDFIGAGKEAGLNDHTSLSNYIYTKITASS
jgi:hypothetical protein